jgi:phthiocerol/phenolphthiocerol synthesis type-I polyketide synthase E
MAAVVADRADAAAVLTAAEHDNVSVGRARQGISPGANRVAFLFPGQGAQHVGMARGLYDTEPVFRENFDRCAAGFAEELGIDLKAEVFDGTGLEPTDLAQPALFAVEYALAQLVMSYGVTPAALAGHSIGELVAATLAGVFDLPAAIKVVSMRARLMHAAPAGAMVAVASNPDDIAVHMTADVDLAAINEPGSCVVAGPGKPSVRSPIALPLKASWPDASEPRTVSIRSRWIRCSHRSPNTCPP